MITFIYTSTKWQAKRYTTHHFCPVLLPPPCDLRCRGTQSILSTYVHLYADKCE